MKISIFAIFLLGIVLCRIKHAEATEANHCGRTLWA